MRYKIPGQMRIQELTERIKAEHCCPACKGEIDVVIYTRHIRPEVKFRWACKAVSCEKGEWEWDEAPALRQSEDDHEI